MNTTASLLRPGDVFCYVSEAGWIKNEAYLVVGVPTHDNHWTEVATLELGTYMFEFYSERNRQKVFIVSRAEG